MPGGPNGIGGRASEGGPPKSEYLVTYMIFILLPSMERTRRHHAHSTTSRHTTSWTNGELDENVSDMYLDHSDRSMSITVLLKNNTYHVLLVIIDYRRRSFHTQTDHCFPT